MAATIGNDGDISLPTSGDTYLQRWRLRVAVITSDVTAFGDSISTTNLGGLMRLEGSASGAPDGVGTGDPQVGVGGVSGAATLTVNSVGSYGFTALINNFSFDIDKTGDALITFDFVGGADDLVETWA